MDRKSNAGLWTIVVIILLAVLGYWWYAGNDGDESAVPSFNTEEAGAVEGVETEFDLENLSK